MMPEEWPIAASTADSDARARLARRGRLDTVRRDFFLEPSERLTEQERALMTAMLHCLVGDVATALRATLPGARFAANDADDSRLIQRLRAAGLLDQPSLMAVLLRRADEERVATAARARSGRREPRVVQGFVSNDHAHVAAAAMALILARGRRRDRFGQCLIGFDDLPEPAATALVYSVAAGLRAELSAGRGVARADIELAHASDEILRNRNPERGIEALTESLAHALEGVGETEDGILLAAANEGEVAFVGGVLAHRAGIPANAVLDELFSGSPEDIMGALKVVEASRPFVAGMLAGIGDLLGIKDAGAAIERFDVLSAEEVADVRAWLLTPTHYRDALDRLDRGRG